MFESRVAGFLVEGSRLAVLEGFENSRMCVAGRGHRLWEPGNLRGPRFENWYDG